MEDTHFLKSNGDFENQYILNNNCNKLNESVTDYKPSVQRKEYEDHRQDKIKIFLQSVVLIAATFVIHLLTAGLSFSIGVYYVVFLEVFNQGNGLTAWIGSINFATLCASGPMSSYLIERIGCYRTIVIGGLLSTVGLLTSVFAVNIYMLFATFGFMTAIWERYSRKKNARLSAKQKNGVLSKVIEKHLSNSMRFLPHYGSQPIIIDTIVSSI